MYRQFKQKIFHIIMIIIIIFVILCTAGILILKYEVEGETNMPFKITKISIIESVEGIEVENSTERWNFNVNENNDIYVYIEKNSSYGKTEIIESINIDNINVVRENAVGEVKFYKPVQDEKRMFFSLAENEVTSLTYTGELESNIKEQKISNQGGIVAFRYAVNNLSQYISEEDEDVDHSKLLQLTNITEDELRATLSFDITINLTSGKKYLATISFEIPADEIIEKGTVGIDITDLENIIFKRIEN